MHNLSYCVLCLWEVTFFQTWICMAMIFEPYLDCYSSIFSPNSVCRSWDYGLSTRWSPIFNRMSGTWLNFQFVLLKHITLICQHDKLLLVIIIIIIKWKTLYMYVFLSSRLIGSCGLPEARQRHHPSLVPGASVGWTSPRSFYPPSSSRRDHCWRCTPTSLRILNSLPSKYTHTHKSIVWGLVSPKHSTTFFSSLVIFKGLCSPSRRWTLICVLDMRRGDALIRQVNVILVSGLIVVPGSDPMSLSGLQVPAGLFHSGMDRWTKAIYLRCPLGWYVLKSQVMNFTRACGAAGEELLFLVIHYNTIKHWWRCVWAWLFFMPPYRRCRRHYVSGCPSVRPSSGFFRLRDNSSITWWNFIKLGTGMHHQE